MRKLIIAAFMFVSSFGTNVVADGHSIKMGIILGLLDRKKLTKNNDIEYDSESGNVINIALLLFNTSNRKFTLNKELNQKKTKTIKKKAKESDS